MSHELSETIKELLYVVFGDVVYELGLKRMFLYAMPPVLLVVLFFLIRFFRRRILRPIAENRQKLDQIAMIVAENQRLLRSRGESAAGRTGAEED